jgi:hypothetical protein
VSKLCVSQILSTLSVKILSALSLELSALKGLALNPPPAKTFYKGRPLKNGKFLPGKEGKILTGVIHYVFRG